MSEPALSIVILTWNSRELLERCIAALPAATAGLATQVIVVDNGSSDGTAELLDAAVRSDGAAPAWAGPLALVVIRNGTNRGVAPARNQGLRRARGELVALLDVDTVPAPGAFVVLADELRRAPRAGLVGPKLVGIDGVLQYSCRRFPSLLDKIGRRLPGRLGRALTEDVELRSWDHASVRAVDYVIGACQVIRAAALADVGLLDERIFYGPEDVDLCLRLQRAGWAVLYVPSAVVMHLERRVTRKLWSPLTARHLHGLAYYFWKHRYLFRRPRIVLDTVASTEIAPPRVAARDVADPALTIAVPASAAERDVAATLASLHASAARTATAYEIVIAINGPERPSPALEGVRAFAAAAALPLTIAGDDGERTDGDRSDAHAPSPASAANGPRVRALLLPTRSKIAAWNALRAAARAPLVVFADADVRVAADAVPRLIAALATRPELAAVAGREVATVGEGDGFVARAGALPYRFDFANIPGRLYALRASAAPATMPANVIAEDGWLTVTLGSDRFVKERDALVFLRPPATWREYWAQRVRHELGKLQLAREFSDARPAHRFGRAPWRAFLAEIRVREYPLVIAALALRALASLRARQIARHGFTAGWRVLPTTKRWPTGGGLPPARPRPAAGG